MTGKRLASTPVAVPIAGRWGVLRPLNASSDARQLFELSHEGDIDATWSHMKVGPFRDKLEFANHVEECVADRSRAFFTVMGSEGPLGWLCLMEAREKHQVIELGYVLFAPVMQRTPLATEAFYLILRHTFEELGYRRVEWTCMATNLRSRTCACRLGFQFEGVMRKQLILKGAPRDICMYSMLEDEWPEQRAAMEDWLDPANFANGIQVRRLSEIRLDRSGPQA